MGSSKDYMMQLDDMLQPAVTALERAGVVERCPYHRDIYIDLSNDEAMKAAYAIGTEMWKRGEVIGSREDFMATIKQAEAFSGTYCPACAKAEAD